MELGGESDVKVLLDLTQDEGMKRRGVAREVVNRIQKLRKSSSLKLEDDVVIFISFKEDSKVIRPAFESNKELMDNILRKPFFFVDRKPQHFEIVSKEAFSYEGEDFEVFICWNHLVFNKESIEVKTFYDFEY